MSKYDELSSAIASLDADGCTFAELCALAKEVFAYNDGVTKAIKGMENANVLFCAESQLDAELNGQAPEGMQLAPKYLGTKAINDMAFEFIIKGDVTKYVKEALARHQDTRREDPSQGTYFAPEVVRTVYGRNGQQKIVTERNLAFNSFKIILKDAARLEASDIAARLYSR